MNKEFSESIATQDMGLNTQFTVKDSYTDNQATSNGPTVSGKEINDPSPMNSSDVDDRAAFNGLKLSSEGTDGHSAGNGTANSVNRELQAPIAICGRAVRLPGGLRTPQQLWDFLLAKGDARAKVPKSRYNVSAFYDPTGKPGTVITEYGYFLDEEIGGLDTSFFIMPRMEVERADPQQRLMLEVTRECLGDAGETEWRGKNIGCYMGVLGEGWCEMYARETQNWGNYRFTGYADFVLSNRISYEMDLQGPRLVHTCNVNLSTNLPSITTRTACSSSLVALHEACMAISRGDCESAVVGGANLIMTPRRNHEYDRAECTCKGWLLQNLLGQS